MPAVAAGDPGMTLTTTRWQVALSGVHVWPASSWAAIVAPMPSNSPLTWARLSWYSWGVMYEENGSLSAPNMPLMAPSTSCSGS